ncbi:MAG: MBL fold metallo-hydrolase [Ferrimicrobium sp.]
MRLTKFGHACVRLENNSKNIVIDPGVMTPEPGAMQNIDAILITHEHFDHFEPVRLATAVSANPALDIYTCAGVAGHLQELGGRVHVVRNGDTFSAGGFKVSVVGEKHHFSHPDAPPVDNVGFVIDDEVFHPGDALTILDVATLLVPGQAPWMTMPDLISYLRTVRPKRAYAIHDGLINEWGIKILEGVLTAEAERLGADIRRLKPGESIEV